MGYFGEGQDVVFTEPVFPQQGMSKDDVVTRLDEIYNQDSNAVDGHIMLYATTLMDNQPVNEISRIAFSKYLKKNMLVKEIAPGLQTIEQELKRMVVEVLNAGDEARVNITSGGSESLYCAINAAIQRARATKPEIKEPEIVAPYTIHAAFSKWCHYTGVKLNRIPVGPDYRADVQAMEDAITPNTIMIAGSSPCWPYGLYDPHPGLGVPGPKTRPLDAQRRLFGRIPGALGGKTRIQNSIQMGPERARRVFAVRGPSQIRVFGQAVFRDFVQKQGTPGIPLVPSVGLALRPVRHRSHPRIVPGRVRGLGLGGHEIPGPRRISEPGQTIPGSAGTLFQRYQRHRRRASVG